MQFLLCSVVVYVNRIMLDHGHMHSLIFFVSYTFLFYSVNLQHIFEMLGGIKAFLSPPTNFLRGTIPQSPLSLWCCLTLTNSCGASALATHRAWRGSISSDTSPSGTPSELQRQDNGTQHKQTTSSFQSHPLNHEKMQRPTYGDVLSLVALVLRRMPTAASVAVAIIDN